MNKALTGLLILAAGVGYSDSYPYPWAPGKMRPGCTATEVCAKGYRTGSIRPPDSYTNKLKRRQMAEHQLLPGKPGDYEEDHVMPLTACGDPRDPENLAPEAYASQPGAHQKDLVELWWHRELCSGAMTPQQILADIPNWPKRYADIKAEGD